MSNIHFDHFITYTSAGNVDDYLKEYEAQGFIPDEQAVRHEPGLRNRFIFLGTEYIEFCWVEDESLFAKAEQEEKSFRAALRPFGIGMIAEDVQTVHDDWTKRGYAVPAVWSKAPRDAAPDAPPAWSFQDIPSDLLPGVSAFALTYHRRKKGDVKKFRIHPNSIFALSKVTFVSPEPEAHATRWRYLLAPEEQVTSSALSFDVQIGPHQASWMSPDAYQTVYHHQWTHAPHPCGETAVLHLLASNPQKVKSMLENAGRRIISITDNGRDALFVEPDLRDGFAFTVREGSVNAWLQERMQRTDEKIEVA